MRNALSQAVHSVQPLLPATDPVIKELRDEFQAKIQNIHQHFDSTIATEKNQVGETRSMASEAASSARHECQMPAQRQEAMETKVEQIAQNVCSKQDFSALQSDRCYASTGCGILAAYFQTDT